MSVVATVEIQKNYARLGSSSATATGADRRLTPGCHENFNADCWPGDVQSFFCLSFAPDCGDN